MRRRNRLRVIVLLVVAVLVGWALWQYTLDLRRAPGTLLSLDPASVSRVAVKFGGGPSEHYQRRDGHWWRTDGAQPVRADDGRLQELTGIAAAPVLDWRPSADFQLAKLGLEPPQAVLILDGQRLEFGQTAVTGPHRYVHVGSRVAQVSVRYTPRPARDQTTRVE